MNNLVLTFFLSFLLIFSCSSSGIKESEKYEGMKKGILRVYVRNDYEETDDEKKDEKLLKELHLKSGKDRAIHLIISYIRANISDKSKYDMFDNRILRIVEKPKIIFNSCNDDFCDAYIDYDTKELLSSIKKNK